MTTSAGVPETSAAPTLRPPRLERLRHDLNHGLVLEQRIDLAQPVGPQFVAIGQQNFEQTPLALSALNHARSFDESSRAGSVVRSDRSSQLQNRTFGHGRPPAIGTSQRVTRSFLHREVANQMVYTRADISVERACRNDSVSSESSLAFSALGCGTTRLTTAERHDSDTTPWSAAAALS